MRVFLAITLPDPIKAQLASAVQRFAPLAIDVKWYTKDHFHLTLAYLGEVSPAILPYVTASADRVCAALPPFACHVAGFGFFGTKRNPQTLWAGVEAGPELEMLHELLWKELKKFGYANEEDEFHPHITLGRCRESARNHAVIEAMDADPESDFGEWEVARVTLFESRLTPRGPIYRTLGHSALTGNV
jgi:2'-5' RNA ligase